MTDANRQWPNLWHPERHVPTWGDTGMTVPATLAPMDKPRQPSKAEMSRREFAGSLVREQIARQFRSVEAAAQYLGLARSALYDVMNGGPSVKQFTWHRVNHPLAPTLPSGLLWAIIEHDLGTIHALEFDANLKRRILAALAALDDPPPTGRRSSTN